MTSARIVYIMPCESGKEASGRLNFSEALECALTRAYPDVKWQCGTDLSVDAEVAVAIILVHDGTDSEMAEARKGVCRLMLQQIPTLLVRPLPDYTPGDGGCHVYTPRYAPHNVMVERDPEMRALCDAIASMCR
jgi:hypothetical protein